MLQRKFLQSMVQNRMINWIYKYRRNTSNLPNEWIYSRTSPLQYGMTISVLPNDHILFTEVQCYAYLERSISSSNFSSFFFTYAAHSSSPPVFWTKEKQIYKFYYFLIGLYEQ